MRDLRGGGFWRMLNCMKEERSVVPFFVCFAAMVLALVLPAMYMREPGSWAILVGLAPFALFQILGLYLILDAFTRRPSSR